jgi:c-di-GMP-binding flagellar brake protein YcgR
MDNYENKRKAHRFSCLVPVDGKDGSAFAGTRTVDISRSGIGFLSAVPVPLHERVAIELALKADTDPVLVVGEVRWVHKDAHSNQYRIGLTFSDIIDGSQDFLDESFSNRIAKHETV